MKILNLDGVLLLDSSGENLRGADLRCADLQGAYLTGADLRGVDLGTTLTWIDVTTRYVMAVRS